MRITRSGLRRIIAEESARILAEANDERIPGGHLMRIAAGFEDEPAEVDFEDEDEDPNYFSDEYDDPADDPNYFPTDYEDLDESEGKGHQVSPRQRFIAYLESVGADVNAIMSAVRAAKVRAKEEGAEVYSEDVAFNLSDDVLDAIPEDDADRWHDMLDAVLADEIDPDAFADAEAHRKDIRDTERSLDREEGLSDYGDDDTEGGDDYDDGGDWYLEEGDGGGYDYDYEDEPEAEMGDPEDPYSDLPKGERPRGGLVHTAGFKGGSPAGALLRRRGGEDLSESIDLMSAGIGAVVGIAALYAGGTLADLAKQVLDALTDRQQDAALEAAHRKASSKMAKAVEALSDDEHLLSLFRELKKIQRSKSDGMAREFTEKTNEINDYIRNRIKDLDLDVDTQQVRSIVGKRAMKGKKVDEARWAKIAGILKG